MYDAMDIVEIGQAFEHSECDLGNNVYVNGAYSLVNAIQRSLVHELHADTDVGVREERAVE